MKFQTHLSCLLLFGLLITTACNRGTPNAGQMLEEAEKYYQQATEINRAVIPALEHLEQERNSINIQGRALTEAEIQRVSAIERVLADYAAFSKKFQAVNTANISQKEVDQQKANLEMIQHLMEAVKALE